MSLALAPTHIQCTEHEHAALKDQEDAPLAILCIFKDDTYREDDDSDGQALMLNPVFAARHSQDRDCEHKCASKEGDREREHKSKKETDIKSDRIPQSYRIAHLLLVSGAALDSLCGALVSANDRLTTHLVPNLVIAVEKALRADMSPNHQGSATGTVALYGVHPNFKVGSILLLPSIC
ncbi:hypothetical protein DFH09DRAFT_1092683 [Mycena vulgaris]|nr:hypothetical protein DFH09DRAFT_1092683 [Mycena vulgaris]